MLRHDSAIGRVFGVGPWGCFLSGLIAFVVYLLHNRYTLMPLSIPGFVQWMLCISLLVVGAAMAIWTFLHLPFRLRGKQLVTTGPYKYVRHPLYSFFLIIVPLMLAICFQSAMYLFLVPIFVLLWRLLVRKEEEYLSACFGDGFELYRKRTGYFLPRWNVHFEPRDKS